MLKIQLVNWFNSEKNKFDIPRLRHLDEVEKISGDWLCIVGECGHGKEKWWQIVSRPNLAVR